MNSEFTMGKILFQNIGEDSRGKNIENKNVRSADNAMQLNATQEKMSRKDGKNN